MHTKHNKLNKPTWSITNNVGIASCGLLIALGCMAFLPIIDNSVSATPLTATAGVAITANAKATVAISVDDQVNIDITPTSSSNGDFVSGVSKVHVATNNTSGYSLYMATVNESGNLEPIVSDGGNTNTSSKAITALTTNTTGTNFNGNTWGYNLNKAGEETDATSLMYSAVPTSTSQAIYTTDSANLEISDDYNLTFGVNIDSTLPAGTYTNSVLVSAVANPITVSELSQLTYMQDMTSSICSNTAEHATKQLVDTRDGKKYWVAKLKDGNCWMTQNLALDLSTDKTLTSADTDLKEGATYTPANSTNDRVLNDTYEGWDDRASDYSWNLGDILLALPQRDLGVGECYAIVPNAENLKEKCYAAGFVDVSSDVWKPTGRVGAGSFNGNNYENVAIDENLKTYDAHYLLGNYYTYYAATAGAGFTGDPRTMATTSICPSGWKLPKNGKNAQLEILTESGTFYQLLKSYGYPELQDYQYGEDSSQIVKTPVLDGFEQNVMLPPMYFVRGGAIVQSPRVWSFNEYGYYESSIGGPLDVYTFILNREVYISYESQRSYTGNSIRCLAR